MGQLVRSVIWAVDGIGAKIDQTAVVVGGGAAALLVVVAMDSYSNFE